MSTYSNSVSVRFFATSLDKIRKGEIDLHEKISEEAFNVFLEEFDLLDPRSFVF